ncbi:peroxide stress protein YaaA [Glaciihabitans sp. UYNi722]|uniref:YaaA family protein n=1 Tax=Glaciihabitans sp. UYNi722 TaxID=3156344 RepID=UPI0033923E95
MLIVLPPSETKRDGGAEGTVLDLARLSHPELRAPRRTTLSSMRKLARNLTTMSAALKLGPNQRFELLRNRALVTSPTMPAIDRYTGVLYEALEAESLSDAARAFATEHLVIHSALFGLLGASDAVPAYRLSHDSRLPGISLKSTWREPIARVLAGHDGLILDLRSEAYVELGRAPGDRENVFFLRLLSEGPDGQQRALNHFNKKGKGEFARALLESGIVFDDVEHLLAWASSRGIMLSRGALGELHLVV